MSEAGATLSAVWRLDGTERLDFTYDWAEINDAVQAILGDLDSSIARATASARISNGHNSAAAWYLFSYRTFSNSANSNIDPVVAGVTFSPDMHGTLVRGDISGEQLGDILFEGPARLAVGKLAILETARDIAEELVRHAQAIIQAMSNPAREST